MGKEYDLNQQIVNVCVTSPDRRANFFKRHPPPLPSPYCDEECCPLNALPEWMESYLGNRSQGAERSMKGRVNVNVGGTQTSARYESVNECSYSGDRKGESQRELRGG